MGFLNVLLMFLLVSLAVLGTAMMLFMVSWGRMLAFVRLSLALQLEGSQEFRVEGTEKVIIFPFGLQKTNARVDLQFDQRDFRIQIGRTRHNPSHTVDLNSQLGQNLNCLLLRHTGKI